MMDEDMIFLALPVVFFILSVGLALGAAQWSQKRIRQKAEDLARYLGLTIRFTEPEGLPGLRFPEWASILLPLRWSIHGTYSGAQVEIHTEARGSGKSRTVYTCLGAYFPRDLGLGLRAGKEGFWSKVGKALFSSQDITLGAEDFDPKVMVKGQNEAGVRQFFSEASFRSRFVSFLEKHPQGWMDDRGVHLELQGTRLNPDQIRDMLQDLTPLAAGKS